MPGIAGIIGSQTNKETISRMTESMKHEEFYSTDTYTDENVALGITSLISANGIDSNQTNTVFAVMDGETCGLPKENHETDLQFLLRTYEKEGADFFSRIAGRFTLVLYDKQTKRVFLVSDRYGFKPLYYAESEGRFIFASEIKAILSLPRFNQEIDPVGVAELAFFNYPLGQRTLVKDVQQIPPASIWHIDVGTGHDLAPMKQKYWESSTLTPDKMLSPEESMDQGHETFQAVMNGFTEGKEKFGLTLTAGYDTRMILSAVSSANVECLTYGSSKDIQAVVAKELAEIARLEHKTEEFESDFDDQLDELMHRTVWITDGLCNIVHCGLLYVFSKQDVSPWFLGFGGSELIRGLQNTSLAFSENSMEVLLSANPLSVLREICSTNSSNRSRASYFSPELLKNSELSDSVIQDFSPYIGDPDSSIEQRTTLFTLFEIFRRYYASNVTLIESQVRAALPYMTHEFISFMLRTPYSILHTHPFSRNPFERLRGQGFSASIIERNNPKLLNVRTDRGYAPRWNRHRLGFPVILWHQMRRRWDTSTGPELPLLRSRSKDIIQEIVQGSRLNAPAGQDYYDMPELRKALQIYPNWSSREWQELTKVVTFELYLRQLALLG
jgi:asparagine synthase (glutamine-hydrolysing)